MQTKKAKETNKWKNKPVNDTEKILDILISHYGCFVPDREFTNALDLTIKDINHHVHALKALGFRVRTDPFRGYCIENAPDRLIPPLIKKGIKTSTVAQKIYYFLKTDSTNTIAKQLASSGVPDGTLVVAEEQTAGRGRMGRDWISPPFKNILASIIFYPHIKPTELFTLTMIASIAVVRTVKRVCRINALIKWPNDVYINRKKVSGILTESSATDKNVCYAVVGIGVNINFNPGQYNEIEAIATSLQCEVGKKISRIYFLNHLLEEIDSLYRKLLESGGTAFKNEWNQYSMILGKPVKVLSGNEIIEGIAEGIDDTGCLTVIDTKHKKREILNGDLSLCLE